MNILSKTDKNNTMVFVRYVRKKNYKNFIANNQINQINQKQNYNFNSLILSKNCERPDCLYNNWLITNFCIKFKTIHYVGIEDFNSNKSNEYYIKTVNNITIIYWKIYSLSFFENLSCNCLFLRGDYGIIFNNIVNYDFDNIILYRAGCLSSKSYDYDKKVTLYLYDDKNSTSYINAKKRFSNKCKFVQMLKQSHKMFEFTNNDSIYDIFIVTKEDDLCDNYKLIYELLNYLVDNKRYDIKILIVGFKDNAEERIEQIYKQFGMLNLKVFSVVSKLDLIKYYNISNILFIPTIHDGNPRIICEAYSCGLKPVCSSLLENGKDQIQQYGGTVIEYNKDFYYNLIEESKKKYDKFKIANIGKKFGKITTRRIINNLN